LFEQASKECFGIMMLFFGNGFSGEGKKNKKLIRTWWERRRACK